MTWATVSALQQVGLCNKVDNECITLPPLKYLIVMNVWFVVKCKVYSHVELTCAPPSERHRVALVLIWLAD